MAWNKAFYFYIKIQKYLVHASRLKVHWSHQLHFMNKWLRLRFVQPNPRAKYVEVKAKFHSVFDVVCDNNAFIYF